jgi:hypothetical protein
VADAPLGQLRCDPPLALLETFLRKLKADEILNGRFDALVVPGDLVAHGIPIDPANPLPNGDYSLLKQTEAAVGALFAKYFPDTLVVPSIGNNDPKYHYQGIDPEDKADFYGTFFQHWFSEHPRNSRLPELASVKQTFMFGGYYRVDLDDKLAFLALNTLYLNKKNNATLQTTEASGQLSWLR